MGIILEAFTEYQDFDGFLNWYIIFCRANKSELSNDLGQNGPTPMLTATLTFRYLYPDNLKAYVKRLLEFLDILICSDVFNNKYYEYLKYALLSEFDEEKILSLFSRLQTIFLKMLYELLHNKARKHYEVVEKELKEYDPEKMLLILLRLLVTFASDRIDISYLDASLFSEKERLLFFKLALQISKRISGYSQIKRQSLKKIRELLGISFLNLILATFFS